MTSPLNSGIVSLLTVLLLTAVTTGFGTSGNSEQSSGESGDAVGGTIGLLLPKPAKEGRWLMVTNFGKAGDGYLSESWRWSSSESGLSNFTISAEYKKQVPPPAPSEVARAFGRAASRASYASTVSDSPIDDRQQWIQYELPLQGEAGYKKIVGMSNGYVTLTLANSANFEAEDGDSEGITWDKLVDVLKKADVQER